MKMIDSPTINPHTLDSIAVSIPEIFKELRWSQEIPSQ